MSGPAPFTSDSSLSQRIVSTGWSLSREERIGAPLARGVLRRALRRSSFALVLLGGGWALTEYPELRQGIISAITAVLWSHGTSSAPPPKAAAAPVAAPADVAEQPAKLPPLEAALPPPSVPAPAEAAAVPAAPEAVTGAAASAAAAGEPASAGKDSEAPPAEQPTIREPYQLRAEAAGLHPDLSRVVLERLTAADLRNAGIAIQKALAETGDDAALVWPRQPKAGEAQFKVHFVPGTNQDCRRYVVTIAKDGWLTTALPMEKCGIRRSLARRP